MEDEKHLRGQTQLERIKKWLKLDHEEVLDDRVVENFDEDKECKECNDGEEATNMEADDREETDIESDDREEVYIEKEVEIEIDSNITSELKYQN
ncbi:hypothetical protein BC936DRAFT_142107, partial [Jimgerdemannia flammicorona]